MGIVSKINRKSIALSKITVGMLRALLFESRESSFGTLLWKWPEVYNAACNGCSYFIHRKVAYYIKYPLQ